MARQITDSPDINFDKFSDDDWADYLSAEKGYTYKKTVKILPKMTYPTVLYPYTLLEINRLQPPLPKEPQKPNEPRMPYKPSEKYESPNPFSGCLVVGIIVLIIALIGGKNIPAIFWLIAIVFIIGGIYFINYNWKDRNKFDKEYPEKLAKYNIEMKQYQKEKQEYEKNLQEYKSQCLKYEKDKVEILSAQNINLYRNKVMREY